MKELTTEEQATMKTLIQLGDSKELALRTVIDERATPKNSELYSQCYYS